MSEHTAEELGLPADCPCLADEETEARFHADEPDTPPDYVQEDTD